MAENKKEQVKNRLSQSLDEYFANPKQKSEQDVSTMYVQSRFVDGLLSEKEYEMALEQVKDGSYWDSLDADSWISSVSKENNPWHVPENKDKDDKNKKNSEADQKEAGAKSADVNYPLMAAKNDTTEKLTRKYMELSVSEREITPRFKSELIGEVKGAGKSRWDAVGGEKTVLNKGLATECTITKAKHGKLHCESKYLGSFDYDPDEFAIGYKEIPGTESENADGSLTKVPVFRYVGDVKADAAHASGFEEGVFRNPIKEIKDNVKAFSEKGVYRNMSLGNFYILGGRVRQEQVTIPKGVKVLDYTFEGNKELQLVPLIPSSVTSAHCAFKDCTRIHNVANEKLDKTLPEAARHAVFATDMTTHTGLFNEKRGSRLSLSPDFEDASDMFSGCKELGNISVGDLPKNILTINGMFAGCEQLHQEKHGWTDVFSTDWIDWMTGGRKAKFSGCKYLSEEFAHPQDKDSSNKFKQKAEAEYAELLDNQKKTDWSKESSKSQAKHKDANAANAVSKTKKVLNTEVVVGSPEDLSLDIRENAMGGFIQRRMVDLVSLGVIGGVTRGFTRSGTLGLIAGVGGTFALRNMDLLPKSIEPALQYIKGFLPEGGKKAIDALIDKIGLPDMEAAKAERKDRYNTEALSDSVRKAVEVSGDVTGDSLKKFLKVNGQALASHQVFEELEADDLDAFHATMHDALTVGEEGFAELDKKGKLKKEDLKQYYTDLLSGLEAYNKGAEAGKPDYKPTKGQTADGQTGNGKADADARFYEGLSMVNRVYASEVMDSLLDMNAKYKFMSREDMKALDQLNLRGVSGLSEYKKGSLPDVSVTDQVGRTQVLDAETSDAESSVHKDGNKKAVQKQETVSEKSAACRGTKSSGKALSERQTGTGSGRSSDRASVKSAASSKLERADARLGSLVDLDHGPEAEFAG